MPNTAQAPLKLIDIKQMLGNGGRALTPQSLAFLLSPQIPNAEQTLAARGIDPRHLPFSDISPQLRDQRQASLANPAQRNPFSVFGAQQQLHEIANTPK